MGSPSFGVCLLGQLFAMEPSPAPTLFYSCILFPQYCDLVEDALSSTTTSTIPSSSSSTNIPIIPWTSSSTNKPWTSSSSSTSTSQSTHVNDVLLDPTKNPTTSNEFGSFQSTASNSLNDEVPAAMVVLIFGGILFAAALSVCFYHYKKKQIKSTKSSRDVLNVAQHVMDSSHNVNDLEANKSNDKNVENNAIDDKDDMKISRMETKDGIISMVSMESMYANDNAADPEIETDAENTTTNNDGTGGGEGMDKYQEIEMKLKEVDDENWKQYLDNIKKEGIDDKTLQSKKFLDTFHDKHELWAELIPLRVPRTYFVSTLYGDV